MRISDLYIIAIVAATLGVSCGLNSQVALQSEAKDEIQVEPRQQTAREPAAPVEEPDPSRVVTEEAKSEPTRVASDADLAVGQPFTLEEGGKVALDGGLGVRFESVVEDSRCPVDVDCVWAGNAEIVIEMIKRGEKPASVHLNTLRGRATEAAYLDYTIELIDLKPHPRTDSPKDEPYRVELLVGKSEGP